MSIPATYNITLYQGDSFEEKIRMRIADATYEDLTNWQGKAQIRKTASDTIVLAEFTCYLDINDSTTMIYRLEPEQTAALPPTNPRKKEIWVWDFQLTDPSGFVTTYLSGQVNVLSEVTR